jgi:hypothetical protein
MNPPTDWIDQARGLLDLLKQNVSSAAGGTDEGRLGGDCRWCPLCQAVAVARGERPEMSAALADVLTAAAAALRQVAEEGRATSAAPTAPTAPTADRTADARRDPPRVVQRIDIA